MNIDEHGHFPGDADGCGGGNGGAQVASAYVPEKRYCYIPICPSEGSIPVRTTQQIFWPDGSLLGNVDTSTWLCSRHVEELAKLRRVNG